MVPRIFAIPATDQSTEFESYNERLADKKPSFLADQQARRSRENGFPIKRKSELKKGDI
jgi:hypothetical protein